MNVVEYALLMLPEVPSFVVFFSCALSLSLSGLSFVMDLSNQKHVTNLTKILGILIAEDAPILATS